jgi:2-oxoglutarate dehydrogenase complex dehydrogenase (E1) component-like enzyme
MRKASTAKRAVRASRAAELNRKGQNPEIMTHAERLVSKLSTSKLSPNSRLPKLAKKKQAATPLQQRQYWEDDETTLSMVMVEQRAQSAKLNALVEKLDAVVLSLSLSKKTQEQLQEHAAAQQAETMAAAAAAANTAAATAAAGATTGGIGLVASTIGGGGRATAQQAKKIAELQERLRTLSSATHADQ